MLIIHDKRIPEEYMIALEGQFPLARFLSFGGISSNAQVYESIKCHPDIYFFQLNEKTIVHAPGVDASFLNELAEHGLDLISGKYDPRGKYPNTVKYNAVRVGNNIFLNEEYIDPVILKLIERERLNKINIPQGYARCSILPAGSNAIVTSDDVAYRSAIGVGMEALLICPGSITLPGQEYGFIGGCGGLSSEGKLFVLGDLSKHRHGKKLIDFVLCHNDGIFTLKGLDLYDAGSLVIV